MTGRVNTFEKLMYIYKTTCPIYGTDTVSPPPPIPKPLIKRLILVHASQLSMHCALCNDIWRSLEWPLPRQSPSARFDR